MQACQNQVFGGRLGVVMNIAIGTPSCMYAHAHATCTHTGRNDEQAEHRVGVGVETASPIINQVGSDRTKVPG